MITRYIVELQEHFGWRQSAEAPDNYSTAAVAESVATSLKHRHPKSNYRVAPIEMEPEAFEEQEETRKLRRVADDILRQVVCDCGNYRHHGVSWMPEGSGEGLSVAVEILRKLANDEID